MATDAEADVALDAGMECIRIPEAKRATRATADTGAATEAAQIEATTRADTGADVANRTFLEAAAETGAEEAIPRSHHASNTRTSDARSHRPKAAELSNNNRRAEVW